MCGANFRADVNRRRPVACADDRDGDGVEFVEAQSQSEQQSYKYAELPGGAEQNYFGFCKNG